MSCNCHIEASDASQKKLLLTLIVINGVFFLLELGIGLYAESIGLIADSLDMLGDAIIYAIAFYAIGRATIYKANAALISGYFQLFLAFLVGAEIVRRFIFGSDPQSLLMIIMGTLALLANAYCLKLIFKQRHGEVHMRASFIFSANDVIANLGIIGGGILVAWLNSPVPDWAIGSVITVILLWGAFYIIFDAKKELRQIAIEKQPTGSASCRSDANNGDNQTSELSKDKT